MATTLSKLVGSSSTTTKKVSDTSLVSSSVGNILGFQADTATQTAAAEAQDLTAKGYTEEASSYQTAADLATRNSQLEQLSGDIQAIQSQRDLYQTVGAQKAAIAGAGFKQSGSAVYQVRDSLQQGYLQAQLDATQTGINVSGYLEEAAADLGLGKAATAAASSATATAAAYRKASDLSTNYSTDETKALKDYLKTYGTTAETDLATGVLDSTTDLGSLSTTTTTKQQNQSTTTIPKLGSGARLGGNGSMNPFATL